MMITKVLCGTALLGLLAINTSATAQGNSQSYQQWQERQQNKSEQREQRELMEEEMKRLQQSQQPKDPPVIQADPPAAIIQRRD
jgi:hypothetical protein